MKRLERHVERNARSYYYYLEEVTQRSKQRGDLKPEAHDLWEVYGKWSTEKEYALAYCLEIYKAFEGFDQGIYSHCISNFTYCFKFFENGVLYQAYITKNYNRYWKIEA